MFIKSLELKNFRNYDLLNTTFNKKVNLILGDNAQGKTNLIEAIYISSMGKSFKKGSDLKLINFNKEEAYIKVIAEKENFDTEVEIFLKIKNISTVEKYIKKDKKNISKTSELINNILIVIFSPEDLKIVKDEPEKRRNFLNREICQISLSYLNAFNNYRKILIQRNTYLKEEKINPEIIDLWDIQLSKSGAEIIKLREKYIERIAKLSSEIQYGITGGEENLIIKYEPNISLRPNLDDQEKTFYDALKISYENDLKKRSTQVGPHRDDIAFFVNGIDMRKYGSQGQQRTCALSLKLAERSLIKEDTGENPILILDDVMSELDQKRQEFLIKTLKDNQLFITTTDMDKGILNKFKEASIYKISSGKII